jgi:LPS-assembly protein
MQTLFNNNNSLKATSPKIIVKVIALTLSLTSVSLSAFASDTPKLDSATSEVQLNPVVNALSSSNNSYTILTQTLDWVPLSALTKSQREALAPGSCGAYMAPLRDDDEATLDPKDAPIRATAQSSRVFENKSSSASSSVDSASGSTNQVILIGDVVVTQGYRQIKADKAQINQGTGVIVMDGQLELREPGLLVLGSDATVNQNENTLEINEATYALQAESLRGTAARIYRAADSKLQLTSATFTQCEPGNNTWSLKGSQITLDPIAQQGVAKNVRLYIKDIPVFYFPYFRFPISDQRLSGFLAPNFSFDDNGGVNISTPYYFNLAPNYDLIFTPHIVDAHGILYEGNFRHLSRLFATEVNTAFLSDDKSDIDTDDQTLINNGAITQAEAAPFAGQDRWLFNLNQVGGSNQPWSTNIDYTKVSDIDYFRDFDSQTSNAQDDNFLNQRISTSYQLPNWRLGLDGISYQILDETIVQPFRQLPALSADGTYQFLEKTNSYLAVDLNHAWVRFDNENSSPSTTINNSRPTGDRLKADYKVTWNFEPEAGFLRPAIALKHLQYQLKSNSFVADAESSPDITVAQASIDGGLFFERDGGSHVQTFEPRLFYFYSGFESHDELFNVTTDGQDIDFDTSELTFSYNQLFRDTRFAGGDRIDDANQLAIGLTTRFFGNQSGREWFSASLGQITYFDDRQVTLSNIEQTDRRSDIAAQITANPSQYWRISSDVLYNDKNNEVDTGNIGVRYQNATKHIFNINYRFVRDATNINSVRQVDAAFITPLGSDRWHLLAYTAYDTLLRRELDSVGAVEYNACCYRLRFGFRRQLDTALVNTIADQDLAYDEQIFIQIHLKGLGGNSKQLDALFTDNIDGFLEWQAIYNQ